MTESRTVKRLDPDVRGRLVAEVDQEYRLARDLAAVRQLLHLTLGLFHERERELERMRDAHSRLRAEHRQLREGILRRSAAGRPRGKAKSKTSV